LERRSALRPRDADMAFSADVIRPLSRSPGPSVGRLAEASLQTTTASPAGIRHIDFDHAPSAATPGASRKTPR
jgi:hypothetical protein